MLLKRLYLDLETCGLHGMPVLIQYAVEDGPITLYEIWKEPIRKTLDLIEWFCEHVFVGFNCAFDWLHICKTYTIFRLLPTTWIPEEHINDIALAERLGQEGPCVKPASALDLMLYSRKGPMQSLMARDKTRIRRVPTALAYALAAELEKRVQIDAIYFAKYSDPNAPHWAVYDIVKKKTGKIDENFKDVVLRFNPAGGLKYLAEHVLGLQPKFHFTDVEVPSEYRPKELGYAPFAEAVSKIDRGWEVHKDDKLVGYAWPGVIWHHIDHWHTNEHAREYAYDDIVYTRALDQHYGCPEHGDDDSILACMVAAVRWHGYKIDVKGIKDLLAKAQDVVAASPVNVNIPAQVRTYMMEGLDEMEGLCLEESTKRANLEAITSWVVDADEPCTKCNGTGCFRCGGTGTLKAGKHPAAERASRILAVKFAVKEIELYKKLLRSKKLHASFKVIGTLSTRMAGGDGLNVQGIKHTKEVREMFPLAWDGYRLCGGDFDSFEVSLAEAVYKDPALRSDLLSGKKIHALFAQALFPGMTYEEVLATAKTQDDRYTKGKQGVFAMLYGGNWDTLVKKLGITEEAAKGAFDLFAKMYPGVGRARQKTIDAFCSMVQPGGIGSAVVWKEPADYIESFMGFRRYFSLENRICRALFELARNVPKEWRQSPVKVVRRDRVQTAGGAVASALYGAAFQLQAANMRAACNHEIQSPGATITKRVQRKIWETQPAGVHEFLVAPMNVHDEIMCVTHPSVIDQVADTVKATVESFRPQVPLIGMDWHKQMNNWGEK